MCACAKLHPVIVDRYLSGELLPLFANKNRQYRKRYNAPSSAINEPRGMEPVKKNILYRQRVAEACMFQDTEKF